MIVIGCDPGPEHSALVFWDGECVMNAIDQPNDLTRRRLALLRQHASEAILCIEQVKSFGMAVGAEVFETVYWSGIFAQAFGLPQTTRIGRMDIKIHLCHSAKAKDGNIRQALIDRFGPVGTKRAPGPLFGMSGHLWSALAVAVTYYDQTHQGVPRGTVE